MSSIPSLLKSHNHTGKLLKGSMTPAFSATSVKVPSLLFLYSPPGPDKLETTRSGHPSLFKSPHAQPLVNRKLATFASEVTSTKVPSP